VGKNQRKTRRREPARFKSAPQFKRIDREVDPLKIQSGYWP
jgi:hypothetical protein